VNATNKDDVKKAVDFAKENNVRLVVKGSGHDYLGRYVATSGCQNSCLNAGFYCTVTRGTLRA